VGDSEQVAASTADSPNPIPFYRLSLTPEIKAVNKTTREVVHLITSAGIDRAGDVVDPAGADVANYLKNPVVMANHDYTIQSIIGRAVSLEIQQDGLWARTKFHDKGLGADAFNLVADGMARAWSIGFRPVEYDSRKDSQGKQIRGFHFRKWELLEYSLVAIPMNPDAVMNAIHRGILHEENIPSLFDGEWQAPVKAEPPAEAARPGANAEPTRDASLYEKHIAEALVRLKRLNMGLALKRASRR
jgi:HK97 family phage prohead protease